MIQTNTLQQNIKFILFFILILWSLFQVWYASPLATLFDFEMLNSTKARAIHLGFAIFLAYLISPAFKKSPLYFFNIILAITAAFCATYLFFFYEVLANRSGNPTTLDIIVAITGIILLLEATRRVLGWPLTIVAIVFLSYSLAGSYLIDVLSHPGLSLNKLASHQWLGTQGIFGIALGVSTSFVFLFVLFGALLEKAGAGNYFIRVSFVLLGHLRGGPAKAAVVASGLSGIISGSSIANVVTTGTFTIPLMKKVGFSPSKAGAIEVAASTNGQLMPPVMGAAAFLMVEYIGISYMEVIKHALLPALLSYIALIYIVHLEAIKSDIAIFSRPNKLPLLRKILLFLSSMISLMVLSLIIYYGLGWIKQLFPNTAIWIMVTLILFSYLGLIAYSARYHESFEQNTIDIEQNFSISQTIKSGIYYLLPIVILLWCLIIERFSPSLSAFWAVTFMIFILLTQRPLITFFKSKTFSLTQFKQGFTDLLEGLSTGAKNMIPIGIATATAGIIVGTVTVTGVDSKMIHLVEFISGGNLFLILFFTAIMILILGMGLPTTANYIVVSSLMAMVIVELGANNGLVVSIVAVHMFVFYFGILADDTPPVGLAAYAAAGIAKTNPIKTGIQGFFYDIRTAILPFIFIFNEKLLLIGIQNSLELILVIISSIIAILAFVSATQQYFLTKNKLWETLLLILISFSLFRPDFWWDKLYPPFTPIQAIHLYQTMDKIKTNDILNIAVKGKTFEGKKINKQVSFIIRENELSAKDKLQKIGFSIKINNQQVLINQVFYGSDADKMGLEVGLIIDSILLKTNRPSEYWLLLPISFIIFILSIIQHNRRKTI